MLDHPGPSRMPPPPSPPSGAGRGLGLGPRAAPPPTGKSGIGRGNALRPCGLLDSPKTIGCFRPDLVMVEHIDDYSAPALLWHPRGRKRRATAVGDAAGEPEPPAPLPLEDVCDSDGDADGPDGAAAPHDGHAEVILTGSTCSLLEIP
eukprot:3901476-Pyramimonas_sp.AAC.1